MSSSSGSDRTGAGGAPRFDERAIDRRLLEQLIARWGEPPRARPLSPDEEERREILARRARAVAAADPNLVQHIERHNRHAERLSPKVAAPAELCRSLAPQPIARFDLSAWNVCDADELRELEPSDELRDCLEHRTPQAFLRDLHRPVYSFGDVQLRRLPWPTSRAALGRAREAVKAAMAERAGDAAGRVGLATALARDGMRELREILARPWADSRPANPLPLPGRGPSLEDYQWFGLAGGYDPDV